MASGGKEYTMTFLLKAASDSSYQAAFAKAKQELSTYQKAIQENNTLLKDISAYQRQEQAVERASQKVAEKAQALREAQAAASAAGNATGTHTAAELKAEAALKNANEQLKQQEAKLRQQGQALQEAGVDTSNLTNEQTRLTNSTAELKREQEALADSQNALLDDMAQMEALAAEAYVVAQAVGKLGEEWKECIDAASGFESAMSGAQAVSGATEAEMSQLNAVAKQLGADTVYTATEIAQAMEYMGLAGWNTQEIMEGIPAVVSLTAAAGEDLSRVSDIVTDSMQALGYGTEDTAHFCDVLANTVTNANTTVDLMGDTLKYVSSTAGALGYSIEDVSTAIAAMANNGIKGSMNGTALRNMLASLAAPSDEAAAALEELGVSLVDDAGETKALNDVITELRAGFSGLSDAEKVNYATTIAGKRAMSGLLAIVNTSQEAYDELAETIEDCDGAAEKMAAVRMDNFAGSVEILDGAVDALKTSIGEVYLDDLSIGAEALAEIVDGLGEFVQVNPEVVAGLTTTIGLFGGVAVAVPAATAAIKLFNTVMAGSALANPAFWGATAAVAVIAGIGTGIYKAVSEIESAEEKLQRLKSELDTVTTNQQLMADYRELSEQMESATLSAEELAATQEALDSTVAALKEAYPELLGDIGEGTTAWDLQTQAILANIEAEKERIALETAANVGETVEAYREAEAAYEAAMVKAQELENSLESSGSGSMARMLELYEEFKAADSAFQMTGSQETLDETSRLMAELGVEASKLTGQEVNFTYKGQIEGFISGNGDIETTNSLLADTYAEAAAASAEMDNMTSTFRDLIEGGYATADEFTLNLSEMGISLVSIGEKVANGTLTQAEAMERYGLAAQEVYWATESYKASQQGTAEAADASTEAQKANYKEFLQSSYAIAAVTNETLSAEAAAVAFNMDLETLNEQLEIQEAYQANVAAACAAVEAGYLDAETAADRFGVSLGAMDAYGASEQIEELTKDMEALQEAYDSAYDSAYTSITGQLSLTQKLKSDSERDVTTVNEAIKSLEESEAYINKYRNALETLSGYGLSADFITNFCDTSNEGMATAIDLVNSLNGMSTEQAQEKAGQLQEAYNNATGAINAASTEFADTETQFTVTSQGIQSEMAAMEATLNQEMTEIAADFNKSSEAYASGLATANAYVMAIQSKISAARAAAQALSEAGTPGSSGGSYVKTYATGGFTSGPSVAGEDPQYPTEAVISFNPAYRDENIGYLMKAAEMLGIGSGGTLEYMELPQLANDGTVYQYGGLTDYGQAMMAYMESTRPAEAAPVYLGSGSGNPVTVSVNYNPTISVSAGETAASIRQQLSDYDDQLIEKIANVLEGLERDRVRRGYGY